MSATNLCSKAPGGNQGVANRNKAKALQAITKAELLTGVGKVGGRFFLLGTEGGCSVTESGGASGGGGGVDVFADDAGWCGGGGGGDVDIVYEHYVEDRLWLSS